MADALIRGSLKLSPVQEDAVRHAKEAGALVRVMGGKWTCQAGTGKGGAQHWSVRGSTIDVLVREGVMVLDAERKSAVLTAAGAELAVSLPARAAPGPRVLFMAGAESEQGPKNQQDDRWLSVITEHGGLFAVMDGVSSGGYGDVAAMTVRDTLEKHAAAILAGPVQSGRAQLQAALEDARLELTQVSGATTATVLLVAEDGRAWVAQAGDSVLYRLRPGSAAGSPFKLWRATVAHRASGSRSCLLHYMGAGNKVLPDLEDMPRVQPGDVYVFATDGCYEELDEGSMVRLVEQHLGDPRAAARRLVDVSLATTRDNTTALIVVVGTGGEGA